METPQKEIAARKDVDGARFSWRLHFVAVGGGAVVVALVYAAAKATGDSLVTRPEFGSGAAEPLELVEAILVTLFLGLVIGPLAAWIGRRQLRSPRNGFLAFSAVGLGVYGIIAFVRADAFSTAIWFNVMHLGAAIPIVGSINRALPLRRA